MPRPFVLPDLGEGLAEAEVVKVLVKEGDVIQEDAPLLEVETDKAQVEIPSPVGGRVLKIHVQPHQTVRVGEVLATFADGAEATAPAGAAPSPWRDDGGAHPGGQRTPSMAAEPLAPSPPATVREPGARDGPAQTAGGAPVHRGPVP